MISKKSLIVGAILAGLTSGPVLAASCSNSGKGFAAFKRDFAKEAKAAGIGKRGLAALASTKYSSGVIKYDRRVNRSFKRAKSNFNKFYAKKTRGLKRPTLSKLKRHRRLFDQVERKYGVQREVLATIWGMETAFGGFTGKHDIVTSLASLTHDCRRSDFFRPNLMAALKIIDKGWISRERMRGARHGEIGQTQFMAKNYVRFGVDFDGNGRRDLIRSVPDVLASTANYLRSYGWQAGQSYQPGTHNFSVLHEWNASSAYQRAIAKFAGSL
ncbi:MAG: murein transglycosylase [Rhizobiaceae bacterium]|nr:murein transglycosylase [Rhizobiaceae bacterium]